MLLRYENLEFSSSLRHFQPLFLQMPSLTLPLSLSETLIPYRLSNSSCPIRSLIFCLYFLFSLGISLWTVSIAMTSNSLPHELWNFLFSIMETETIPSPAWAQKIFPFDAFGWFFPQSQLVPSLVCNDHNSAEYLLGPSAHLWSFLPFSSPTCNL